MITVDCPGSCSLMSDGREVRSWMAFWLERAARRELVAELGSCFEFDYDFNHQAIGLKIQGYLPLTTGKDTPFQQPSSEPNAP